MTKTKKIILGIVISILVLILGLFIVATISVGIVGNSDEYKIENNSIPSIKEVVGKRQLTSFYKKVDTDKTEETYSYKKTDGSFDDVKTYVNSILDKEDFLVTKDAQGTTSSGSIQVSKLASEDGNIIIMDVSWNADGYTIVLTEGKGTLTKK